MAEVGLRTSAAEFIAAATRHPECITANLLEVNDKRAMIELVLNVEMPTTFRVDGKSPTGVLRRETVVAKLDASYPWSSPLLYLRQDFPRDFPHLQPGPLTSPPRPCLIDGSQSEYFFQFGLVELGVFGLIDQLVRWLQRAAEGTLIEHGRGWEPTLRRELNDYVIIDAENCRSIINRNGGHRVLKARFRQWTDSPQFTVVDVSSEQIPLKRDDKSLFGRSKEGNHYSGSTVGCIIWPDKLPSGANFIADCYLPETIDSYAAFLARADELNCGRSFRAFMASLEHSWTGYVLDVPVPIPIVLCARRPCPLTGSASDIELLPYMVNIHAAKGRSSLLANADAEPVAPASQIDTTNPVLFRNITGAPAIAPVAVIGAGSVGSKIAVHLARSGVSMTAVSDQASLRPHNMARHGVIRNVFAGNKASEVAQDLKQLGQVPAVYEEDLLKNIPDRQARKSILPANTAYAINTTASLGVREALSALTPDQLKARLAEVALFGRGEGGFLLVEGHAHNPTLSDAIAELYASLGSDRLRQLMFDPSYGLTEVQIGQACGSLTMPMTDMRLSAMTAVLTEEFVAAAKANENDGLIVTGVRAADSPDTHWVRQPVRPFETVEIEGSRGWTLRISQRVHARVREEAKLYPGVETGGVLIGMCSARLKVVHAVDLVPAPPDSERSATHFVLGTKGLKAAILDRHRASGGSLFDVGTWHTHLSDFGPSELDRSTAKTLASERPPPSILLIVAPTKLYALMHREVPL